jgi:hypothetical protein
MMARLEKGGALVRLLPRVIAVAIIAIVALVLAASARAATRSGSETFNPNQSAPTFNPPPLLPLITIAVTYDDSGTITVSESGGVPSYFSGWQQFDLTVTGPHTSELDVTNLGENNPGGQCLSETGIGGSLCPQTTTSADRSTITYVWSSPYLANQNYTFVDIEPTDSLDNNCFCDVQSAGSFYFPGYAPSVSISNPGPQEDSYEIGPIAPVVMDAELVGVADGENGNGAINPPGITSFTATGLPPGLSISGNGISGTPTSVGTFNVTVSATGQYNGGTETTSGSTSFQWVIDPPPPAKMPTNYNGDRSRPGVVVVSPTGALVLAGYRSKGIRGRLSRYGRLRWTRWTVTDGWATGGLWQDDCRPACVNGTFHAVKARVHVYRQNFLWSMFTRMTVYPARERSFTLRAYDRQGIWYWQ